MSSGGDTTMQGATASGNKVTGTVGGNLNLSSLQDTSQYQDKSQSSGFSVSVPIDGQPATVGNGSTTGFVCQSSEQVDAWHAAGVAAGGSTCEDPPGVRTGPAGRLYLAYLRDPDGHKICALYRPK